MHYPLLAVAVAVAVFSPPLRVLRGERPAQLELFPRRLCDSSNLLLQVVLVLQVLVQQLPALGAHRIVVVREFACVDGRRLVKAAALSLQTEPFGMRSMPSSQVSVLTMWILFPCSHWTAPPR